MAINLKLHSIPILWLCGGGGVFLHINMQDHPPREEYIACYQGNATVGRATLSYMTIKIQILIHWILTIAKHNWATWSGSFTYTGGPHWEQSAAPSAPSYSNRGLPTGPQARQHSHSGKMFLLTTLAAAGSHHSHDHPSQTLTNTDRQC